MKTLIRMGSIVLSLILIFGLLFHVVQAQGVDSEAKIKELQKKQQKLTQEMQNVDLDTYNNLMEEYKQIGKEIDNLKEQINWRQRSIREIVILN